MDVIINWLTQNGASKELSILLERGIAVLLLVTIVLFSSWLSKRFLVPLLARAVRRSSNQLDDVFYAQGFFHRLSRLLPVAVLYAIIDMLFPTDGPAAELIMRLAMILFVIVGIWAMDAALLGIYEIIKDRPVFRNKPVRGYIEAAKILLYLLATIFTVSILTDKSPWGILSVLGGLTAVVLLIFKDTILGFIATLRLSGNDMVRVGDWIEMPKYDADGDVTDVSIHTVKVRNWDKTITYIPTHVLIADNFKNWRGMQETGGRRIKRAINLDMESIRFCTPDMLQKYSRYTLVADYIRTRQQEIDTFNREHHRDVSQILNGRHQTNLGIFRAYCAAYLRSHPKIHQELTFLVRHLAPTPQGLPLEIYVFTNDVAWANYEGIQADIFDHLLAAVPHFDLRLFQYPSGYDLRGLTASTAGEKPEQRPQPAASGFSISRRGRE